MVDLLAGVELLVVTVVVVVACCACEAAEEAACCTTSSVDMVVAGLVLGTTVKMRYCCQTLLPVYSVNLLKQ